MKKDLPSIEDVVSQIKRSLSGIDEIECFDIEVKKKGSDYVVVVSGYAEREIIIEEGTEHDGLVEKIGSIVGEKIYIDNLGAFDQEGEAVGLNYSTYDIESKWE